MLSAVILRPWERRVAAGIVRLKLSLDDATTTAYRGVDAGDGCPNGWFAVYEKTPFCVFEWPDTKHRDVGLLVQGRIIRLTSANVLTSSRGFACRTFTVDGQNETVVFDYQRLWWNLIRSPTTALTDIALADDWWGVVCDLPGWVEAHWKHGKLADELSTSLRIRSLSE